MKWCEVFYNPVLSSSKAPLCFLIPNDTEEVRGTNSNVGESSNVEQSCLERNSHGSLGDSFRIPVGRKYWGTFFYCRPNLRLRMIKLEKRKKKHAWNTVEIS